jgi:predicted NBD/HSP70 family sugar kinase
VIPLLNEFLQDHSLKNSILKNLYHLIHEQGPISKVDISQKLNIKQTTLTRMIDELLNKKFIIESGIGKSSGGRPPTLYEINPTYNYIIGVDIARIHTKVVLVDLSFNQMDSIMFPMTSAEHPEATFAQIAKIIRQFMQKHHITLDQILGIGVGAVGPLDRKDGIILQPEAFPSPTWTNVPVVDILHKAFPTKVMVENGANTAVFAEYFHSAYKNILYCISGAGIRCGVMANGHLVHSKQGDTSAYGHIIIDVEGRDCSCGKKGCLDSYVSFSAILKEIMSQTQKGIESDVTQWTNGDLNSLTIDHVIKAMEQGDRLSKEIILKSAYYYGIGLANMVNILHPEVVILNGPLIYESPMYYEEVVKTTLKHIYATDKHSVTFGQGKLKSDAVAVGAANLVFHSFFK